MRLNDEPWPDDLLQRAKDGDGGAFDVLIQPQLEPAFRLAMTILRDRPAAEDAVQEATLRAWLHLERFRPGARPTPWFLTIVANQCRSARRARWWAVIKQASPTSRQGAIDPIERLDLQRALDRLPASDRLVLSLYYHLDLPLEDVAVVLGISPGAAKLRLHRARQALRPALQIIEPI